MLYGDSSLTGRTVTWDFANYEIARRPLQGWGYQSFWLAGPGAPSIIDAPGWVKTMPDAHNDYVDTKLELGYNGLGLLLIFIITTLHGVGHPAIPFGHGSCCHSLYMLLLITFLKVCGCAATNFCGYCL
jgi:O-antigen ligase